MNLQSSVQSAAYVLSRQDAEDFLYREARFLDEWKLIEWATLFSEDGEYLIPPLDDPDGAPGKTLFLVYDDHHRLTARAQRLMKKQAHAEYPRAIVRHMIHNVEVEAGEEGQTRVRCNFVVYRSRGEASEVFPGHSVYDLKISSDGDIKIRRKRTTMDSDTMRDQKRLSI
ncbi:MAG: p-cumate dioxygenase, partial [Alphaproteobacteria bacterium]